MLHSYVAASVRGRKETHPEWYCPVARCLWRTYDARSETYTPCGKHGRLHPEAIAEVEYMATQTGRHLHDNDEMEA